MRIRIGDQVSEREASAIAMAIAEHLDSPVELFIGDAEEPIVVEDGEDVDGTASDSVADPEGLTERERAILEEIEDIHTGGPKRHREKLDEIGKLFVRERLDRWFDDILFEDGTFVNVDSEDRLPADGLITGAARFDGRTVHFMANDYTVKAGSMAEKGVEKFLEMQHRSLKSGRPILYLMDSSGGRIDQQTGFFANREGIGKFYYNHSLLSGWVPQICVLYGPCIAGAAYTPVFADFTVMVEDISAMAIASPRMVEMVTGEEISLEDLGGPSVHARETGSADLLAQDEDHALELVRKLMGYLPANAESRPPHLDGKPPGKPAESLDSMIPKDPHRGYDMHDVIEHVIDEGSFLELKPEYGEEVITAFARIDGRAIGIIANQPNRRAGAIFPESAEKAAGFIWTADAFDIPLLYLCDTPGFMAGSKVERAGILEAGKKMIYATSSATVPQLTVIVRKAYGAGIYAMGGPAFDTESVLGLPAAEIAIMGPEAAVNAVYARELAGIDDPDLRAERIDELREEFRKDIDIHRMASEGIIDELVPPSQLREQIVNRFTFYRDVRKPRPEKKHGTIL